MEAQTLDDLKRENEEEEAKTEEATVAKTEEVETESSANEELETEESAETTEGESSEDEPETWQTAPDEQGSEEGDHGLTDGDAASMRRKYQGKIEKIARQKDEEIDALKARLDSIEKNPQAPVITGTGETPMPTLESTGYDEPAYQAALVAWMDKRTDARSDARTIASAQSVRQQEVVRLRDTAVNDHYERASALSESSGIAPEAYRAADLTVRQAIEAIAPSYGDLNTDILIGQMGAGSEKVMFYLGRNPAALETLKGKLLSDASGMSASMYLGELKGKVAAPSKRTSLAAKPANTANGDASGTESGAGKAALKKYKEAHKKGSIQAAYDAKKSAKAAGVDTSKW